jgi:hypothetical protein
MRLSSVSRLGVLSVMLRAFSRLWAMACRVVMPRLMSSASLGRGASAHFNRRIRTTVPMMPTIVAAMLANQTRNNTNPTI